MSECNICYESVYDLEIALLSVIKHYKIVMDKNIKKLLCSYFIYNCNCLCGKNNLHFTCINCYDIEVNLNICNKCKEHCCDFCYSFDEETKVCKRCESSVCFNCIGICWCQCYECICNKCVVKEDIPNCVECAEKIEIPVCVDAVEAVCASIGPIGALCNSILLELQAYFHGIPASPCNTRLPVGVFYMGSKPVMNAYPQADYHKEDRTDEKKP